MTLAILWGLALISLPATLQAEVNKCVINGNIVYTDQECPADTATAFVPPELATTPATDVTYTGAVWLKDSSGYAQAIEAGKQQNLPVLIYGYTDWCGYCKKLEKTYFNDYAIRQSLGKFIKVKINPEHSRKDDELFTRLGGTGYPTLFIQHPNQPLQRISDPFVKLTNGKRGEVLPAKYHQTFLKHLQPYENVAASP